MSEERKALERLICRGVCTAVILLVLYLIVPFVWDKLSPFIIAVPIAALLQPVIGMLQKKLKLKRGLASMLPVVVVCAVALLLIYWFVSFGVGQVIAAGANSGTIISDMVNAIKTAVERLLSAADHMPSSVVEWLRSSVNDGLGWVYEKATLLMGTAVTYTVNLAAGIPYALIYANFLLFGLYFIAKDYPAIRSRLPGGQARDPNSSTTQLTNTAIAGLLGYLKVQTTFALLSLLVSWIYLQCLGFPYAVLIASAAALLEFLPLVGNGTLYVPWAIVAFLTGDTMVGVELMILDLFLLLVRRVTEPMLLSSSIGISPLLSLIGMFVGMRMGGILGMIGGPVVMVVLVGIFKGSYLDGVLRDCKTLVKYLRARWA